MKRIRIFIVGATIFCSMAGFFSCYDDKSSLATNFIDEVVIDTTGIKPEQYIGFQERLTLAPGISIGGENKDTGLLYEWALAILSKNNSEFEVISTDKALDEVISRPISSAPYTLRLTVTDTSNDNLQYLCSWDLYIQSSFLDGLLIADTRDGSNSDLTLVMNDRLTVNYEKEEKIYRQILENANGTPYPKLMTSLTYEVFGYATMASGVNQVWAVTSDGGAVRFLSEDFSFNGNTDDESIFTYKPAGLEVKSFFRGYQMFFANTTGGIYSLMNISTNSFGWYDAVMASFVPDNDIIAAASSSAVSNNHTVWLDELTGRFISYSGSATLFGAANTYEANSIFDPNNLSGHTAVAAEIAEDGSIATFLLKEDASGSYAIYTLGQYRDAENPAGARNKYLIPNEGKGLLDDAVSVFFAQRESVLYVATGSAIYAILYGSGDQATVSTTPKYTVSSGEVITKAKLYQQGHYTNDSYTISSTPPYVEELPWNNRGIILATRKSDTEGKVYVIPISQPGIGTMDPANGLAYDGFGRILDVITVGY